MVCAQASSHKELLMALLEDVHGKQAEIAALHSQQELTAKAVAAAASERDGLQRLHAPHDALVHDARALADSKQHVIKVLPCRRGACAGLVTCSVHLRGGGPSLLHT